MMGQYDRYLILKTYFGLNAISITNFSKTYKERMIKQ